MTKPGGSTQAADAADDLWGEALNRWYAQEQMDLPPPEPDPEPEPRVLAERPFPPGWWILPAIVMSLAIWAVIGWMILT